MVYVHLKVSYTINLWTLISIWLVMFIKMEDLKVILMDGYEALIKAFACARNLFPRLKAIILY